MTSLRYAPALLLLVVCVLLAAGCADQFPREKPLDDSPPTEIITPEITAAVTLDAKKFQNLGGDIHTVAKGDYFNITGFAGGSNATAIAMWMFGNDYVEFSWIPVNEDGSYRLEIHDSTTRHLESGPYYIVIQHQGANDRFDISYEISGTPGDYDQWVVDVPDPYAPDAARIFKIDGNYSITGYQAAKTLVQTLKDPRIDEYSSVIQVFVEDPWITIDAIGNQTLGEPFTFSGRTNLAEGNEVFIIIQPSWYQNWCCYHDPRPCPEQNEMVIGSVWVSDGEGPINTWMLSYEERATSQNNLMTLPAGEYYGEVVAITSWDAENSTIFRIMQ